MSGVSMKIPASKIGRPTVATPSSAADIWREKFDQINEARSLNALHLHFITIFASNHRIVIKIVIKQCCGVIENVCSCYASLNGMIALVASCNMVALVTLTHRVLAVLRFYHLMLYLSSLYLQQNKLKLISVIKRTILALH